MLLKRKALDDPSLPVFEVPQWLAKRREISQGAKLAYAAISFHLKRQEALWKQHVHYEVPSQAHLGNELGVSDRQFRAYANELQKHGLVETGKSGWGKCNQYEKLKHSWLPRKDDP